MLIGINGVFASRSARTAADTAYDRTLAAALYAIAEQVTVRDNNIVVYIPAAALEMFESRHEDRVFYRVRTASGTVLNGYGDLPDPPPGQGIRYFDTTYRGEPTRFAVYDLPLFVAPEPSVSIMVGETTGSRVALAHDILFDALLRQGLLLLIALAVIWLGVRQALRPLVELRDEVQRRDAARLEPIRLDGIASEVRPLVEALNQYMMRLESQIQFRSRFIADASHQLRTPLTLLHTQAEYALRQSKLVLMRDAVAGLHLSTQHAIRLVNQLLTLSRAEPESGLHTQHEVLDLRALARDVALEFAPAARKKKIDLSFDADDREMRIRGNPTLLYELVANLVDNALHYTPRGGAVAVAVKADDARIVFSVTDSGPGIPPTERERVFERFYSLPGQEMGSGLGLAIVKEIGLRHEARVTLCTPDNGQGLRVSVSFPAAAG